MITLKCIKTLYKSTYFTNAFTKNKTYEIVSEDNNFIIMKDNHNNNFDFSKSENPPYYYIGEYFNYNK